MRIQHNLLSMYTNRQLGVTENNKTTSTERLSTGYRINRAADDTAGLAISEKMRSQIRGLEQASRNVQEGIDFCNVADSALGEVQKMLQRMKELSVKAANDTYNDDDRAIINEEIKQIKKEINNISTNTEFNTFHIFNRSYDLNFSDDVIVIGIFDATNGDPSAPETYGGIIINDQTRIAWKDIDSDMVYTDATTGETLFNEGTYEYDTGSYLLKITCEVGSKPPQITAEFPVTSDLSGITIAGTTISWSDVLNEDNIPITQTIGEEGIYHFDLNGGTGSFFVPEGFTMDDLINGIKNYNDLYERKYTNVYSGYYESQAVDIVDTGSDIRISNAVYTNLSNSINLDFSLRADTTGIWVDDTNGNEISGSKKTWSDLGINSWDSGSFISDDTTYQYLFNNADYNIEFNFHLLNETSIESVIDGIENASIKPATINLSQATTYSFTSGNGLVSGTLKTPVNNYLTIEEEAALGRNFDSQTQTLGKENLQYDSTTNKFSLTYPDTDGNTKLTYDSIDLTTLDTIKTNASEYVNYLTARRIQALLSGDTYSEPTLDDVIGKDKITTLGYLSETVTIDTSTMKTTGDIIDGTYPTAMIDFSGLGTDYDLYDLLGTGFNSTCKTCENHYSVVFVYENTQNTTSSGFGYTLANDGAQNYSLQIDLKSFVDKGIESGNDFADALVDVFKDSGFDFHFTQYAAEDSKLYVCDNREQSTGAPEASFNTTPFEVDTATIDLTLKNTQDNRALQLQFTYDVSTGVSAVAQMMQEALGEWVVDDINGGYKKFVYSEFFNSDGTLKNGIATEPNRYNLDVTNNITSWEDYYDSVMNNIAKQSEVSLESTDYAYANYYANENANSAIVSTFDFEIEDTKKGFWIQSGANSGDGIALNWDTFNTYSLGVGSGNVLTKEDSSKLIEDVDTAEAKISRIRSTFGAYSNRMERMYNAAQITSGNLQNAESRIRDTDMAEEIMKYSKNNIISQATQAMLTQANQYTEKILMLLQQ